MLQLSYRMERRCIIYQFQARITPLLPLSNTIDVSCDYNFVPGSGRVKPKTAIKPAFSILLYCLGQGVLRIDGQTIWNNALCRLKVA